MTTDNTKPTSKTLFPAWQEQNPSAVGKDSQDRMNVVRSQVDRIMEVFLGVLPSNYVSQVQGPFYTMQFQAAAEQIAKIQIAAQEAFADTAGYDYMRPEFMYQIVGALVFPDAETDGYPTLKGDLTYREFLKRMVYLLLGGATKANVQGGLELLSDAAFEIIERAIAARDLEGGRSAWGYDDQFAFEINVTEETEDGRQIFPDEPFVLQENVRIVLRALKPAHTLYDYRHLFREAFGDLFSDTMTFDWQNYYYDDLRKWCLGAKRITGTGGVTWEDRALFSDSARDFEDVSPGADLTVLTGPNSINASTTDRGDVGRYRVEEILTFPVGDDNTPRAYTTSPTGLTGFATVSGDDITDEMQDFGGAAEGETMTFADGPNAGTYLLKTLRGRYGAPVGHADPPPGHAFPTVRVAHSLLRIRRRMPQATTGQEYEVVVDRLGVQEPRTVEDEDASLFFTAYP